MSGFLTRYATPLVTGLFLVSLVSGVALFFHIGSSAFHAMHEWLSIVLIVPFVLHIWKNWRAFLGYFKRLPMMIALAASLAAGAAFAIPAMTSERGPSPQRAVYRAVESGSLATVAPLFGHDAESLMAALREKGLTVTDPAATIEAVAGASGKRSADVLLEITALKR